MTSATDLLAQKVSQALTRNPRIQAHLAGESVAQIAADTWDVLGACDHLARLAKRDPQLAAWCASVIWWRNNDARFSALSLTYEVRDDTEEPAGKPEDAA